MKVTFDAGPHMVFRLQPSGSPQLPLLTGPNRHEPWDGVATEARKLAVLEGIGWFQVEKVGTSSFRWGAQEATCILWNPTGVRKQVRLHCNVMGLRPHELSVRDGNGGQLWRGMLKNVGVPCSFELELDPGETLLQWILHGEPVRASPSDRRLLGFRVNDLVVEDR